MALKVFKAIRCNAHGGVDVLKLENLPMLNTSPTQVLIKVFCAGVNPVDTYIREGKQGYSSVLPYTPGKDCSGMVEECGANVSRFQPGDRVYGSFTSVTGCYAEYSLFEEENVFPLHSSVSYSQGAAIGVPYFTAYRALFKRAQAKAGQVVLVHGASGAVGLASVQLAKSYGMTVLGTAGTPQGMEVVRKCGADDVFNHREDGYTDQIMKWTQGKGIDVILEMLADVNLNNDLSLLARNGTVAIIGSRGEVEITPRLTMMKETNVVGVGLPSCSKEDKEEMSGVLWKGQSEGWLRPVVGKEFPLEEAGQAQHQVIHNQGSCGKIVLKIQE